jgi:hypothetical protein
MTKLVLNENSLTGSIPESLGVLLDYSLQLFDASSNFLSGALPQWVSVAPKYGAVVKLDHNPFACPIPAADLYSGATCVNFPITNLQPKCLQSNSVELVWGLQWPLGVDLWCGFSGASSSFLASSLAEMINSNCLSCNTPNFGAPTQTGAVFLNIFLQDPTIGAATRITNDTTPVPILGSQGCPITPVGQNSSNVTRFSKSKKTSPASSLVVDVLLTLGFSAFTAWCMLFP